MEQLSALDAAFVYLESSRTPMHIGGVYLIDGATAGPDFDPETVRRHVAGRLQLARTFRQRLVEVPLALGHPYWVEDPDFDLARHMPQLTLPEPAGKREVYALAAELFAEPLARDRPLWELALVPGLNNFPGMSPGSMAIIGRVHHAAVDGMSGAEIMGALLDPSPEGRRDIPPDTWEPEELPGGFMLAAKSYRKLGGKSIELARVLRRTVRGAGELLSEGSGSPSTLPTLPFVAPRTPINVPVGRGRSFGGVDFDLERIKAVRQSVPGATVNDVVLAVCSGALRRWLEAQSALPTRPLVAMVPMSVRSAGAQGALGNQVSALLVELATDLDDPHQRLAAIRQSTRGAKTYGRALPAHQLLEFVPSETAAVATRLYTRLKVAERHRPFFNLVITNVPGPPVPVYLSGAPVYRHVGMAPVFDGLGMILVIFSLAGRLSIGITACSGVLADAEVFEELLEESLAALESEPAKVVEADPSDRPAWPELEELKGASERLGDAIDRLHSMLGEEE